MSLPEGGGGTFALPSPTHAHQMDVTSAVRSLRRSISRSPSRFLRQTSGGSERSAPASPQSPCRRFRLTPQHRQFDQLPLPAHAHSAPPAASYAQGANTSQPNASYTPLRSSSSKLSLRSVNKQARTSSPSRQLARARASPKSPLRRALNATSDHPNAAAQQSVFSNPDKSMGQENRLPHSPSHSQRPSADKPSRHSLHLDVSGSSENAFLKALDAKGDAATGAGGLKRNDAMMNLDQPYQGSPVAKRRSMHGASGLELGGDRNIFALQSPASGSFRIHEDKNRQADPGHAFGEAQNESIPHSPSPGFLKRSSSLRKASAMPRSTDKNSWGKRVGQRQLAQLPSTNATPVRSRTPVAKELFEPPSETPFFGSTTPAAPPPFQPAIFQLPETRNHHPLAQIQTVSASSSGNSLGEDTPSSYVPAPPPISRFSAAHPFSRSLPLGAERPVNGGPPLGQATPNQGSLLYHGAFASTGLISKVNRNPEQGDKKMVPPDTPCKPWKKPSERFNTYPMASTPSTGKKTRTNSRHSCGGISSLTFQPPSAVKPAPAPAPANFGTSLFDGRRSIFGRGGGDTELFQESNYEPVSFGTPTKHGMTPSFSNLSNLSELSEHCSDEPNDSPSANRKSHGHVPLSAVRPDSPLGERHTPRTPHELSLPENTRQLSISIGSANNGSFRESGRLPPATPTSERDFRSSTGAFSTPVHDSSRNPAFDTEPNLQAKFDEVTTLGGGQFSTVFRVKERTQLGQSPLAGRVFVVKKSKRPYQGLKDRERKLREPKILHALKDSEHVVQYIADWEANDHLYIQTEFCENGTLEDFFLKEGFYGRLDDFCIFKILLDLTLGLKEIHDAGFMHLDMKPANVLVTFEGGLKIGDFGLAREISDRKNLDMEGDREYMAPEMLQGKFGRSSDIFSLGIIIFEAMANVVIPGNGDDWHRLRSGDFSGVPSLSWTASSETHPYRSGLYSEDLNRTHDAGDLFGSHKRSELLEPPTFMDAAHPESLQSVITWMMIAAREQRPTATQLLSLGSLEWIAQRRKAPATIFEGRWGPIDTEPAVVDVVDTEMTGV